MKKVLIEKLESFAAAPFTIQRISELLSDPRKQYSRIDKFMRAVEKTILVVSTVPPGRHRSESENGDSLDSALNGDFSSEVNVDIDMDHDPGFGVTKELPVARKDAANNAAASDEPEAAKKSLSPSKESEAGTSGTSDEKIEIEESDAKMEKEVEAPATDACPTKDATEKSDKVDKPETPAISDNEKKVEDDLKVEVAADPKPVETLTEQKIDDAHLNEPIRSNENEILVDAAEIISETTPLAALENIVAIQTETADIPSTVETTAIVVSPESEVKATEVVAAEESEIEAKRLKVSESVAEQTAPVTATEEKKAQSENVVVEEVPKSLPIVESPTVIEQTTKVPETIASTVEVTPEPIVQQEKIDEPVAEVAEAPVEMVQATEDIAETPSEMETVPIVTENKMSLDEEDPPAIELEMTPIANKMDTDEPEAAPMDFEDDSEPMDQ